MNKICDLFMGLTSTRLLWFQHTDDGVVVDVESMGKSAKKAKLSRDVTVDEFTKLGAELMNRDPGGSDGRVFQERWTQHFLAEPVVVADVWQHLAVDIEADPDAPDDKIAEPVHLLWALMLLKMYSTEAVLSGLCGVDEDMFRKWARHDIEKHSMCFRACAVFVQLSFEVGSKKLFDVTNYDQAWMDPTRVPLPESPDDAETDEAET